MPPNSSIAPIFSLPSEIFVLIQNLIDPLDIISLRKTCRRLKDATYDREVWLSALLYASNKHDGFLPTFPLEEMSQRALEQAALNPYRFASLLANEWHVEPVRKRVIPPMGIIGEDEEVDFVLNMIPGGRFLLVLQIVSALEHDEEKSSLHLLDLGYYPITDMNPTPICSLTDTDLHSLEIHVLRVSMILDDPQGIRIFVDGLKQNSSTHQYHVYDAHPLSPKPSFELIAALTNEQLKLVPESGVMQISGWKNVFSFLIDSSIVVWDFILNEIAVWRVGYRAYSQMLMVEDTVILFLDAAEFVWWKIPLLIPLNHFVKDLGILPARTSTLKSPFISNPTQKIQTFTVCPIQEPTFLRRYRPLRIIYLTKSKAGHMLHHFDLDIEGSDSDVPCLKFVCEAPTREIPRSREYAMGQFSCANYLQLWLSPSDMALMITISKYCTDTWSVRKPKAIHGNRVLKLWEVPEKIPAPIQRFDLCPLSARCCIAMDGKIYFMDF